MPTKCPVSGCGYNANMEEFDAACERPLILKSTRSHKSGDAHRDMDGFDVDEELARIRRALKETEADEERLALYQFIAEALGNIDEHLMRLGSLPRAWQSSRTFTDYKKGSVRIDDILKFLGIDPPRGCHLWGISGETPEETLPSSDSPV